jgi:DnaK suppressor protein
MNGSGQAQEALLALRQQVLARLAGLERDLASSIDAARSANTDDEHDPEGVTIAFERQHVAAHVARAREQLREIDAALGRLAEGTYGVCASCGRQIAAERLSARPAATACIDCAARAG